MNDFYNQLREVAEVRYDDGLEMDSIRKTHEGLQRCRENAEAFRRNYALTGQTGQAVEGWLQRYHDVINIREQVLRQQVEVHERAREHMREARDQFHALRTDLVSDFERWHFQEQEVYVIEGHEVTGDAYIAALAAQRQQEREDKAEAILRGMDAKVDARTQELTSTPSIPQEDLRPTTSAGDANNLTSWGSSGAVAGGMAGAAVGAGSAAGGDAGSSAGVAGGRVSGVESLPGDAGAGAGSSGVGGSDGGGRVPGVSPLPGEGGQRPYVRPPAPGRPGSVGYPISNPTDLADLPLTTSPVFSDGMDGGYVPPSVTNASDPRWSAGAGVGLQSGLAVGSVAAMGGGLLASRGGPGVSGGSPAGGVGRGGYGVVPAGGVIGRPAPGTPGAGVPATGSMPGFATGGVGTTGPGAAGAGAGAGGAGGVGRAAGAGGPVVAGGAGGAGAPGAEGAGARSGRGSLRSSLAEARAAVARAAGTSAQPSAPVIKPSEGNTGMIGAGQGGRGKDDEERRRRRGYAVPRIDRPDDHQHDAGHWAFGAGSADTLPPAPQPREDRLW